MSAAAVPTAPAAERPDTIAVIRDDGPVATALGRALGPSVPLPAAALAALGSLPLLALIAFGGGDVAVPFAGAAILWAVVCGGVAAGRPRRGRLRWTATPAARLCELAGLLWLAALAGDSALPAAFALLAAIAYRGYDLLYRVRQRGVTPAPWVNALALGWDGRLVLGFILLAAGALPAGFYLWAAIAGAAFVGESAAAWLPGGHDPGGYDQEDDE